MSFSIISQVRTDSQDPRVSAVTAENRVYQELMDNQGHPDSAESQDLRVPLDNPVHQENGDRMAPLAAPELQVRNFAQSCTGCSAFLRFIKFAQKETCRIRDCSRQKLKSLPRFSFTKVPKAQKSKGNKAFLVTLVTLHQTLARNAKASQAVKGVQLQLSITTQRCGSGLRII